MRAQIFTREGIELDRSTLGDWVGKATALLEPMADAIGRHVLGGQAIFADDTPIKLQAPGEGRTRMARIWTYVRDERPWLGPSLHVFGLAGNEVLLGGVRHNVCLLGGRHWGKQDPQVVPWSIGHQSYGAGVLFKDGAGAITVENAVIENSLQDGITLGGSLASNTTFGMRGVCSRPGSAPARSSLRAGHSGCRRGSGCRRRANGCGLAASRLT